MADNGEILRAVGSLEGKFDGLSQRVGESNRATVEALAAIKTDVESIVAAQTTRLNHHSDRLRALERRQSWFLGGIALGGVVGVPTAAAAIAWIVKHWPAK